MAMPVYLWLYQENGIPLKGSADIHGKEGSIELMGMDHEIFIPTDDMAGAATGMRHT